MFGEREDLNTSVLTTPEVMTAADVMTVAPIRARRSARCSRRS